MNYWSAVPSKRSRLSAGTAVAAMANSDERDGGADTRRSVHALVFFDMAPTKPTAKRPWRIQRCCVICRMDTTTKCVGCEMALCRPGGHGRTCHAIHLSEVGSGEGSGPFSERASAAITRRAPRRRRRSTCAEGGKLLWRAKGP